VRGTGSTRHAFYYGQGQGFLVFMGWLIGSAVVLRTGALIFAGLGVFLIGAE
jgi:hypothetical protein